MKILAIDTSCDETAAAATNNNQVLSNIIWSQASAHAKFGGVMPSLAKRMHEERINWVISEAIKRSQFLAQNLDAIAVTCGPGLAIALEVGIIKAKEIARKYRVPLIPVNHIEAHLLSPLTQPRSRSFASKNLKLPAYGLCISGGNTIFTLIKKIGQYQILAQTQDDALGEALDKAARMLGLGYPGGAVLEKLAKEGNPKAYSLPLPLAGRENQGYFSYSGLKTAFYRLIEKKKPLTKVKIQNLAASFQSRAFDHLCRVVNFQIAKRKNTSFSFLKIENLWVGGGVSANIEVRRRLRALCQPLGIKVLFPYSQKLNGDNAAMVGACAALKIKYQKLELKDFLDYSKVDREPTLKI